MELHGHLGLPADVRIKLLEIRRSTVERILSVEKERAGKSISTTKPGNLFKHQIQVRTFADWGNVIPCFLEADLVAHCGGNTNGAFLNTLTLTDITTGWTECLPLLRKSANDVIIGLKLAQELLPFPLLGVDTDNGSEFINHELMDFCDDNEITFTRSRAYRKNDQAHVEEKNGSIVRRVIGYDRFEGRVAWEALSELYRVIRVYINFFQPSLKLLSKERNGARVSKMP
jgi:IS30 family transposase